MLKKNKVGKIIPKTKVKLQWIEENINSYEYQQDLAIDLAKQFNLCEKYAHKLIKVYLGQIPNTRDVRNKLIKPVTHIKTECYFCLNKENLVGHHISYNPEHIITLCRSCHNKIHFVLRQQHETELQRSEAFVRYEAKIKQIKRILENE